MLNKLTDSVFKRSLIKKLEARLAFYQDRFVVLDRQFKALFEALKKPYSDEKFYLRQRNEFFINVMPKREQLLAVMTELEWLINFLKTGSESKGLLEKMCCSSEESTEPSEPEESETEELE